jgi:general secretion pathway protein H
LEAATMSAQRQRWRGLTLVELMVVLLIIGIATALTLLALPDSPQSQLQADASRLVALLESARAASRAQDEALRWRVDDAGFRFEGRAGGPWPSQWLHVDTQARVIGGSELLLGPEPVIGAQSVALSHRRRPESPIWVGTDGVRPFQVMSVQPLVLSSP